MVVTSRNRADSLPMLQVPDVGNFRREGIQADDLLGIMGFGGAIGQDHHLIAIGLVAVGDPRGHLTRT